MELHFRVGPSELGHECTLSNGWKSNEPNAGHPCLGNIESNTRTTPAGLGGCQELSTQLGELGLEDAQMVGRGLVLLGAGHLALNVLDLVQNGRHGGLGVLKICRVVVLSLEIRVGQKFCTEKCLSPKSTFFLHFFILICLSSIALNFVNPK